MAGSPKTNGKSTPKESSSKAAATAPTSATSKSAITTSTDVEHASAGGKPDRATYDVEQNKLRSEIDALQIKFVRSMITSY